MSLRNEDRIESLPYGTGEISVRIPVKNYLETIIPRFQAGVEDERGEILSALHHPIGTPPLREMARKGMKTVVVVNDVTRPTPTYKLLPPLLEELEACGIQDRDIFMLVATGTHRDTKPDELEGLLGKEILSRFRVINHHCQEKEGMVDLGTTSQGIPIVINRLFYETDLKILTGSIDPHQSAGYSGGRKSLLPGLASLETLKLHHGYGMRSSNPAMGWVEGNPFHLSAVEAAKKAGADFILNVVQNHEREIIRAVAGDVEEAWLAGVQASRKIFEVEAPQDVDIVITSPGGHPRDINLYQSQKSMAAAELVVKKGGTIILPAACPDGVGSDGFYEWMDAASCPEDVVERFIREGYSLGTSKAWMYSRCLTKNELIVVSDSLDEKILDTMFTKKASTVEEAIEMAMKKQGKDAKILLIKNATDIVPTRKA
jgi:nickel-dependent lactate racemase